MFKAVLTCVLFFVLCEAEIKINITVASNTDNAKVEYEGEDNKNISDMEINLFNLSKENLCKGVTLMYGKAPYDIYLQDPTPLKALPVMRNMKISRAKIVTLKTQPNKILLTSHPAKKTQEPVKKYFDKRINSTWSSTGLPSDETYLNFEIKFDKQSFKYRDNWRNSIMTDFSFGGSEEDKRNIEMALKTISGRLSCDETNMYVNIEYSAKLIGNVIGDYQNIGEPPFILTIDDTMKAANLLNEIKTTQRIEIRSYTNPKFEVYDNRTGNYIQLNLAVHVRSSTDLKTKLAAAGDKLVVIFFMATSCEECQTMETKLNEMSNDMVALKVNVDNLKVTATEYNITATPTFVFIKNSTKIEEFSGANVEKLRTTILKHKIKKQCITAIGPENIYPGHKPHEV